MKKLFITIAVIALSIFNMQSQNISKNALGLRLGSNDGFGGELSYQRKMSKDNRIELDLGWRSASIVDAVKIAGVYQWVWNIDGDFNWYAGLGGGLGSYTYNKAYKNNPYLTNTTNGGVYFFGAGDIGIEYDFDIPLLISLDFRPEFNINGYGNNFGSDIALGLRYQF